MITEQRIFRFIDPGRLSGGTAVVGVDLLDEPTVSFADFRVAGTRLKPQNIIGFLLTHGARARRRSSPPAGARARRRSSPPARVVLDVVTPSGKCPVEISFQQMK